MHNRLAINDFCDSEGKVAATVGAECVCVCVCERERERERRK